MNLTKFVPIIARTFLAVIFLRSGWGKLMDPTGTIEQMQGAGLPLAPLLLVGAIAFELIGAISVIVGYKTRWGATLLILFLIPATLVFHTNFAEPMQVTQFFKNLSILGGLLLLVAYGAGSISVDAKTAPSQTESYGDRET